MIKNTLTEDQIQSFLKIPEVNDRKTAIGRVFNDTVAQHKFVWQNLGVGTGKTHEAIELIKRIRKVNKQLINVVVPTEDLRNNWLTKLEGISNVKVWIINSYTKPGNVHNCFLLIVDEVDRASGDSMYFSTVFDITERNYTVVLAAELEKKHVEFLKLKGLQCTNFIKDSVVELLELKPKSVIYNVPIELTSKEKFDYANNQANMNKIDNFFLNLELGEQLHYFLPKVLDKKIPCPFLDDWTNVLTPKINERLRELEIVEKTLDDVKGIIKFKAMEFMKLIRIRADIIYNAKNKNIILDKILEKEQKQAFIFFNSIEAIDRYVKDRNVVPYHSKLTATQKNENMLKFLTTTASIGSINNLIYGFDIETKAKQLKVLYKDVSLVINHSYVSSPIKATQKTGRGERLDKNNKDKVTTTYCLYIEDFIFRGETYLSQEKVWLRKSQKGKLTKLKIIE